jgi:thiamine biosynthesis lipoprotein
MKLKFLTFIAISACLFAAGCTSSKPVTASDFALNTYVSITLYGKSNEDLAKQAVAKVKYYENIFSKTLKGSQLYILNENGFISNADTDLYELVEKGKQFCEITQGSLDISIGPLTALWNITGASPKVPSDNEIAEALSLVNYENIKCTSDNTIMLGNGMQLDLGAIAKGFIADKIYEFLYENGVTSGIINLGGNILCIGDKPGKGSYTVGIQKPFGESQETILSLDITDMSVVTSGTYERYFEEDGKIYHHIIDPQTGCPAQSGLCSVTIISGDSFTGDCLSTACLVMGKDRALELVDSMEDVYAILIDDEMNIYYSDGAQAFVH